MQPFITYLSKMNKWTNLSYANVATTSPKAHLIASEWAESLARGGAAEFDADAEKVGMMPFEKLRQHFWDAQFQTYV